MTLKSSQTVWKSYKKWQLDLYEIQDDTGNDKSSKVNQDSEIKVDNEAFQKVTHYNYLSQHISTPPS